VIWCLAVLHSGERTDVRIALLSEFLRVALLSKLFWIQSRSAVRVLQRLSADEECRRDGPGQREAKKGKYSLGGRDVTGDVILRGGGT
jgi:hypothetical protein